MLVALESSEDCLCSLAVPGSPPLLGGSTFLILLAQLSNPFQEWCHFIGRETFPTKLFFFLFFSLFLSLSFFQISQLFKVSHQVCTKLTSLFLLQIKLVSEMLVFMCKLGDLIFFCSTLASIKIPPISWLP